MAAASPLILLTGATGFVGRQVLLALGGRDCRVRAVVREGKQDRLPRLPAIDSVVASPDIFAERAAWWAAACRGIDTVVHVAWYAEPGHYLRSPKNRNCLAGTLRLAQGAIEARVRRFVGIGTCFEYDLSAQRLSVDSALKPVTPYAEAKAEAFKTLSGMLPRHGIAFAWCRLFYLYGEGEDPRRLVPYLRAQCAAGAPAELSSGEQIRDYLDVREAGRMIAEVALGSLVGPVNICSGIPVTVRQLAERIADEYGRRDLLRFGARADAPTDPPCVVGIRAAR
jgi:dTDP-6-deoxy-L-talose 4-dehydrogenase (NAD+)